MSRRNHEAGYQLRTDFTTTNNLLLAVQLSGDPDRRLPTQVSAIEAGRKDRQDGRWRCQGGEGVTITERS